MDRSPPSTEETTRKSWVEEPRENRQDEEDDSNALRQTITSVLEYSSFSREKECQNNWSGSSKINARDKYDVAAPETSVLMTRLTRKATRDLALQQNFVSSLAAGVGSGLLASVVCAPLDLLRTRMQVAGGLQGTPAHSTKIMTSLKEIYLTDGMRGCFRGLGATLATVPAFWGLYFSLYERCKGFGYQNGGRNHPALVHLSSAMAAGGIADTVCNPMFIVRTRMQTEALHYLQMPIGKRRPQGLVNTVIGMYKEGGVPIFWRGLTASLLGLGHVGIQFPVYERLKTEARKRSPTGEESPTDLIISSGLSKMTASIITYPHEVIRSRMMDAREAMARKNVYRTMKHIIEKEGYRGLYVGLRVSLFRVVPNCCVTFVSYEMISRWARGQQQIRRTADVT